MIKKSNTMKETFKGRVHPGQHAIPLLFVCFFFKTERVMLVVQQKDVFILDKKRSLYLCVCVFFVWSVI